jgi:hypothetical protein
MHARHGNTLRNSSNTHGNHMRVSRAAGESNSPLGMLGRSTDRPNNTPRRETPLHARAASAKQRAPPEINHAPSLYARRECISVSRGAGDARSRPAVPGCLVRASHQNMGASSTCALAKTRARAKINHAQSNRSRIKRTVGPGWMKCTTAVPCRRRARDCRDVGQDHRCINFERYFKRCDCLTGRMRGDSEERVGSFDFS